MFTQRLCHLFTQKPMTERKIDEAMGAALVSNNSYRFHRNFISHEKKVTRRHSKFTEHYNLFESSTESVSQEL